MGSALRILLALVLVVSVGLSACGRRGSLDRPKPAYPEIKADPSTKMSQVPDRQPLDRPTAAIDASSLNASFRLPARRRPTQNVLHAEEVDLADLAAAVGTPFYCYSTATLERHYRVFADAFAGSPTRSSAIRSRPTPTSACSPRSRGSGAGMDVVSEGELRRALAVKVAARADRVLRRRQDAGPRWRSRSTPGIFAFNVESEPELRALSEVAEARGKTARIALRVNPDVDAKTHHKIATGKAENKFGVPFAEAPAALSRLPRELPDIEAARRAHAYRQPDHRPRRPSATRSRC